MSITERKGWCVSCGFPLNTSEGFHCDDFLECDRRLRRRFTLDEVVIMSEVWTVMLREGAATE